MKASANMRELVSATEEGLKALGFDFTKNDARELVEFDVEGPSRFMVRITHLPEMEYPSSVVGMGYSTRQRESNDFRIYYTDGNMESRLGAAGLVRQVLASLRRPPWKGLGIIESGTAKALWKRASEGRE